MTNLIKAEWPHNVSPDAYGHMSREPAIQTCHTHIGTLAARSQTTLCIARLSVRQLWRHRCRCNFFWNKETWRNVDISRTGVNRLYGQHVVSSSCDVIVIRCLFYLSSVLLLTIDMKQNTSADLVLHKFYVTIVSRFWSSHLFSADVNTSVLATCRPRPVFVATCNSAWSIMYFSLPFNNRIWNYGH